MRDAERLPRQAVLAAAAPFGIPGGTRITVRIDHLDGTIGQGIGRFKPVRDDAAHPLEGADLAARVRPTLALPVAERTAAQADELAAIFRSTSPLLKPAREALAAARKALADLQIPSTLVMKERPSFERPSFQVRVRGSFSAAAERVSAGTPARCIRCAADQPVNRLGLARWLVDASNPLVARVAVNRLWEQIFGRGLVETSEDFGAQGSPPTHPELLDWLATEFVAKGWSQKAIVREILLSSTYRQSSAVTRGAHRTRSVQPAAGARSACPYGGRDGSRRRARGQWTAQPEDVRPERVSIAARWHLEHALQQRQVDDE